jgi:DNA-binding transcriptional ArsR family regulator
MHRQLERQLKAVASVHRLRILDWLKQPREHFRPQLDGDLVADGVCALLIAEKLALAQPTTAQHLKALVDAGFLIAKRTKRWTFYRRDEQAIDAFKAAVGADL